MLILIIFIKFIKKWQKSKMEKRMAKVPHLHLKNGLKRLEAAWASWPRVWSSRCRQDGSSWWPGRRAACADDWMAKVKERC